MYPQVVGGCFIMPNIRLKALEGGTAVAYLSGRIDISVANEIEVELNEYIDPNDHIKYLLINMAEVEYLSSSGFRVMVALLRKLKEKGGTLKLCSIKPEVQRIFDVIEMTSLFEIFPTEESALK